VKSLLCGLSRPWQPSLNSETILFEANSETRGDDDDGRRCVSCGVARVVCNAGDERALKRQMARSPSLHAHCSLTHTARSPIRRHACDQSTLCVLLNTGRSGTTSPVPFASKPASRQGSTSPWPGSQQTRHTSPTPQAMVRSTRQHVCASIAFVCTRVSLHRQHLHLSTSHSPSPFPSTLVWLSQDPAVDPRRMRRIIAEVRVSIPPL